MRARCDLLAIGRGGQADAAAACAPHQVDVDVIVMEGIRGDDPVSVLCRREGIHANLYYKWLKDFMEAGKSRLKGCRASA